MSNSKIGGHYSQAYDDELKSAVNRLLEMAALAQQQVTDAVQAFTTSNKELAQQVKDGDRLVNNFEIDIDEHCLDILVRRQPAATDFRLVIAVLKSIYDVERIGDLAKRIAKTLLKDTQGIRPEQEQLDELLRMNEKVQQMLQRTFTAFKTMDASLALEVLNEDKAIDDDYSRIIRTSIGSMMDDAGQIGVSLQVAKVARALERVGDHSRNICHHAIFLSKGRNVSHVKDEELQQIVSHQRPE